ncbi:MAG TPA: hypothetical protein VIK72_02595 [Clostridiaceae bacterium]
MNPEKNLIFVKSEDKTEQINHLEYDNGKWRITYCGNARSYTYSFSNVVWYREPKVINSETSVVYENNQPISGVVKILDFGEYIRIILSIYRKSPSIWVLNAIFLTDIVKLFLQYGGLLNER